MKSKSSTSAIILSDLLMSVKSQVQASPSRAPLIDAPSSGMYELELKNIDSKFNDVYISNAHFDCIQGSGIHDIPIGISLFIMPFQHGSYNYFGLILRRIEAFKYEQAGVVFLRNWSRPEYDPQRTQFEKEFLEKASMEYVGKYIASFPLSIITIV